MSIRLIKERLTAEDLGLNILRYGDFRLCTRSQKNRSKLNVAVSSVSKRRRKLS